MSFVLQLILIILLLNIEDYLLEQKSWGQVLNTEF